MLENWSKEQKYIVFLFILIILDFIFLLSSELTKKWYSGGTDECKWDGDAEGIYSSDCYSHKNYSDTKCSGCSCCSDQVSVHKLGNSIITFVLILIFQVIWVGNLILILLKKIFLDGYYLKLFKIITIPGAFLAIIVLSVESFGITHEKLHAGISLRIIAVTIFALFTLSLFCLTSSLNKDKNRSYLNSGVTPLSTLEPGFKTKGNQDMLINKDTSSEFL
ncbi:hypothetical protein SteCoe_16234 [Stentor coeruleus]|uniref:Uncharacterized protein n=1 Tax=Stentor coeruleus TaxID=5963 RepID=A0A1R2C1Y1_9CILI|nr:hypothetical protein SteCoe_16234 [Stentor coeruleus]